MCETSTGCRSNNWQQWSERKKDFKQMNLSMCGHVGQRQGSGVKTPLLPALVMDSYARCLLPLMYPGAALCLRPSTFPPKHENTTSLLRQQKLWLTEKPDVVRTREQRNGRPLISKLDNAASEGLCVNSILSFPEANVARTGLAQEAGI